MNSDFAGTDLRTWSGRFLPSDGSGISNVPLTQMHDIAKQSMEAVMDFHQMGWMHNDIKPENFFILNGRVVIADFDGATRPGEERTAYTHEVPELFFRPTNTSVASDYFLLGLSFYSILFGRDPITEFLNTSEGPNSSSTQPHSNRTGTEFNDFVRGKFETLRNTRVLSEAERVALLQLERATLAFLSIEPRDRVIGVQLLGINRQIPAAQLSRVRRLELPRTPEEALAGRNVCESIWTAVGGGITLRALLSR